MRMLILTALVLLAGCAQRWEKPGATEAEFDRDLRRCEARALERHPPRLERRMISGGYFAPPRTRCHGHGKHRRCRTVPGRYMPPVWGDVDLNRGARRGELELCLREHGWRKAER